MSTARDRAISRVWRERIPTGILPPLAHEPLPEDELVERAVADNRLKLIFMCCHPALALDALVAHTCAFVGRAATRSHGRFSCSVNSNPRRTSNRPLLGERRQRFAASGLATLGDLSLLPPKSVM